MTRARETGSYPTTYETSDTPHQNDGDFLSLESVPEPAEERPFPRPIYSNPVREGGIKTRGKTEHYGAMSLNRYEVTMKNGAAYDVSVAMSERPNALDIAHLETTSLTTQPDGVNMLRMRDLAQLGIPTVYQSVQKNPLYCGGIRASAHDALDIHAALAERYGLDPVHVVTGGISRGGARALNVASVGHRHNTHVVYTDAEVPAPPRRIDPARFLTRLVLSWPHEVAALLGYRDVPLDELIHYYKTVDVLPHKVVQQFKEVPELLSGKLGERIERTLPTDSFGYVVAHEHDMFTDPQDWVRTLAQHPHMIVETSPGAHMSCAGQYDRAAWRDRMASIAEVLRDNPTNRILGGAALHALAAQANSVFGKPLHSAEPGIAA